MISKADAFRDVKRLERELQAARDRYQAIVDEEQLTVQLDDAKARRMAYEDEATTTSTETTTTTEEASPSDPPTEPA